MKPAVNSEIKQELNTLSAKELLELCLQLAKYKKDNKELLSYLLFEADDLPSYIAGVKEEIELMSYKLRGRRRKRESAVSSIGSFPPLST